MQAVILQLLGDKGIAIIGGDAIRGFTTSDQALEVTKLVLDITSNKRTDEQLLERMMLEIEGRALTSHSQLHLAQMTIRIPTKLFLLILILVVLMGRLTQKLCWLKHKKLIFWWSCMENFMTGSSRKRQDLKRTLWLGKHCLDLKYVKAILSYRTV
ncbi:uncharacterized protein LOC131310792 isoform X3 [Rhododendron vialii]|uniref:uncharacterized protein LOC131310792 isoform X3 n=1 Tax=Rhododendron vialii TaxID=182163 RepID=UPI00266054E1|nr:uncharacterized protein LOC131310792 isoform X3 [Rhododendron vialii]